MAEINSSPPTSPARAMYALHRRVGRDVGFSVGGVILDLMGQLFLGILLARALGPSGVALYYVGTTIAVLILSPLSPGMATLVPREVASGRSTLSVMMGAVLSFRLLVTFPVSAIALVVVLGLAAPEYWIGIVVGYGLVAIQGLILTLQSAMEAEHRFDLKVMAIVLYRVAVVSGAAVSLILLFQAPAVLTLQLVATFIVLLIVGTTVGRRIRIDFRGGAGRWPMVVRRGYPILLTSILFFLGTRLDTLILASFVPARDVGLYSTATLVITAAAAPSFAVVVGVFPSLVAQLASGQGRSLALRAGAIVGVYGLIAAPVLVLLGSFVLGLLFGRGFEAGAPLLAILAISLIPMTLNRFMLYYLIASDRPRGAWFASAAGLVTATGLNLILIPRMGATAAAIDSIVGETTCLVVGIIAVRFLPHHRVLGANP